MIEMWKVMLLGATSYKPFQTVERLFLGICLVANVIIAGTFQVCFR